MMKQRITRGRFIGSSEEFQITDDFTKQASAHRLLRATWVGETEFRELEPPIINKASWSNSGHTAGIVKSVKWADMESDDDEVGHESPRNAKPHDKPIRRIAGDGQGDIGQLSSLSDGRDSGRVGTGDNPNDHCTCQLTSESLTTFLVSSSDAQVGAVEPKVDREGEWQTDADTLIRLTGVAVTDSQTRHDPSGTGHLAQGVIAAKIVVTQATARAPRTHTHTLTQTLVHGSGARVIKLDSSKDPADTWGSDHC